MRRILSLRGSSNRASPESEKVAAPYARGPISPTPSYRPPSSPPFHSFNRRGESVIYEDGPEDDEQSNAPLVTPAAPPPPPNLKVKRVDYFYSTWSKVWKYRNTSAKVRPDALKTVGNGVEGENDPWQSFCFVVVRKLPQPGDDSKDKDEPTFQVVVKSPYLLIALKDVVQKVNGVSWTAEPLELDPYLLLTFLPRFEEYRKNLEKKTNRTTEQSYVLQTVTVLIDYLRRDYAATLSKVASLTAHGEITFDTLFAIFIPRSIVVANCPVTGEPRAFELVSAIRSESVRGALELMCESVDAIEDAPSSAGAHGAGMFNPGIASGGPALMGHVYPSPATPPLFESVDFVIRQASGGTYGRVQHRMFLTHFKGTVAISSLDVYPIGYHPKAGFLEKALMERGKKWVSLRGIHHMQYDGAASYTLGGRGTGRKQTVKYNIKSRVMIDRGTFRRMNPNYEMPIIKPEESSAPKMDQWGNYQPQQVPANNPFIQTFQASNKTPRENVELTEEELMLAPAVMYGFSLSDKTWLELNIQHIQPIVWNDEAFENLVLPDDRKDLLKSLVESHDSDAGFDDFVHGKGHGLVINLFGPPGVGKTLSAEATSEHVRRPLYVVGGGDLGTNAGCLDQALSRVLDIATSWNAIVLIDEADVFLEQRSLHDMERNAMVAVFLRHVEYYRGILFMTTNRVKAFDEAFLSRIHVALHFQELTLDARRQVWTAFLKKVGVDVRTFGEHLVDQLAERPVNGRQIKNAVRTASSLATSRKVPLSLRHLTDTLDTMDEFTEEVKGIPRT